jgi:hypothetical protein
MITNLNELCAAVAPVYEACGYAAPTALDVLELVAEEERQKVARLNQVLKATENGRHERTFLRDEKGQAYGHVAAEIPQDLYLNLMKDPRFGPEALATPDGIREIVKQFPSCGVKHVGLKHIGRGFGRGRVNFGRGTMNFAR